MIDHKLCLANNATPGRFQTLADGLISSKFAGELISLVASDFQAAKRLELASVLLSGPPGPPIELAAADRRLDWRRLSREHEH